MEFADLQALIRTTAATLLTAHDIERAALALVGGEKSVQVEGHFNGLTNRCWSAIRPRRRSESPRTHGFDGFFIETKSDSLRDLNVRGFPVRRYGHDEKHGSLIL